jgi:hypothetical protein
MRAVSISRFISVLGFLLQLSAITISTVMSSHDMTLQTNFALEFFDGHHSQKYPTASHNHPVTTSQHHDTTPPQLSFMSHLGLIA